MLQYHTTSDPETILLLPLTAISPKHSFHWQDKPAMFFIPPNHLAAESIHLDHCLLRVFEFLLPFLPHTICLSPPSQQPSFNHFFITPLSLWPVHPHKLPLSFSSPFLLSALNIHYVRRKLHVICILGTRTSWKCEKRSADEWVHSDNDSGHAWFGATCWPSQLLTGSLSFRDTRCANCKHPHGLLLTPDRN